MPETTHAGAIAPSGMPEPGSTPAHRPPPGGENSPGCPSSKTNNLFSRLNTSSTTMKVLIRTPEGIEEVREVDSDYIIPGDILDDGSIVLDLWDELTDDDFLAIGLYD